MINREEYINLRQGISMSGNFNKEFIPYMYEYYMSYCREREIPPACTEEQFPDAFDSFIKIPVQVQTPLGMVAQHETLQTAVNRTMKYFDELYKNNYND